MTRQDIVGAFQQYWTVEEKPRLNRRNTYFEDHPSISSYTSLKLGIAATTMIITIVIISMVGGII